MTVTPQRPLLQNKLQRSAEESCAWRGHALGDWVQVSEKRANNDCTICGMGVTVNTRPMPNQIDIGGEAVALDCSR